MSTESAIGAVVGGVIGFFVGGPAGAMVGAGIGMGLGAALTPMAMPGQQGPRLSDLKVQTSTYGAAIPRVYGTVGITGNVIWLEGNKLKEVVTRRKVKSGGKGGSKKTTVTTYTYYATLAIGLCEGPIAGVRRIWAGPKLIYDAASDDLETIIASNRAADSFTIYRGTADQQPDSRIQADRGVTNTPAYRGLAYVVIKDFLLTDYGNAVPAFKVEVVRVGERGPAVVGDVTKARSVGGFSPVPAYISSEKVVFYSPRWDNTYPASSTYDTFIATPAGVVWAGIDPVSTPPGYHNPIPGLSDSPRFFRSEKDIFSTAAGLSQGRYRWRGEYAALYNSLTGMMIFGKPARDGFSAEEVVSSAMSAVAFDIIGESLYVADGSVIRVYGADFSILQEVAFSFSVGLGACMSVDAGQLYLYTGTIAGVTNGSLYRISADLQDIDLLGVLPSAAGAFGALTAFSGGLVVQAWYYSGAMLVRWIDMNALVAGSEQLSDVVAAECAATGLLDPGDYDVSALVEPVPGYRVSKTGSIRSALETLAAAFPFDAIQAGYQLRFVPRGGDSIVTIDAAELIGAEQLPQSREMDSQLPATVTVQYLDRARNYDANEQFAERINTSAVNATNLEVAVVMGASQSAAVAERLLALAWLERGAFGPLSLPPQYRALEPTDVITLAADYAEYRVRLTEVSYNADGTLTCSGLAHDAAAYVSAAQSDETPSQQTVSLAGDTELLLLDIPVIDETIQTEAGIVAAVAGYSAGWPGAVAVLSSDDGQTWSEIQAFDGAATIGYVDGALPVNSCTLVDESAVVVRLLSGAMESVAEAQMLAGTNWAAYGVDGRWEIVRFRDAVLQADGSYLVSGFKRGDKGTEWATGLHQIGDLFIPLDDGDLAAIGLSVESIGVATTWRGVTAGDSVDSASDVPLTYRGVNLRPLSPAYPVASRNGSGDLALAWTRRSRLGSSWWATGTTAPLGEASEAYEVDILDGSTVVRAIASSTPSISYTAAEQTADFGAPQASIAVRIHQLSAVVGRGYALEVTA